MSKSFICIERANSSGSFVKANYQGNLVNYIGVSIEAVSTKFFVEDNARLIIYRELVKTPYPHFCYYLLGKGGKYLGNYVVKYNPSIKSYVYQSDITQPISGASDYTYEQAVANVGFDPLLLQNTADEPGTTATNSYVGIKYENMSTGTDRLTGNFKGYFPQNSDLPTQKTNNQMTFGLNDLYNGDAFPYYNSYLYDTTGAYQQRTLFMPYKDNKGHLADVFEYYTDLKNSHTLFDLFNYTANISDEYKYAWKNTNSTKKNIGKITDINLYSCNYYPQADPLGGSYTLISGYNEVYASGVYDFYNIAVSGDYEGCIAYINGGDLPPDAEYKESDDNGLPTPDSEDDNPNSDGQDNSSRDDMELPTPTTGVVSSGSVAYYLMNGDGLKGFFNWFWTNTPELQDVIENLITNVYGNMSECIVGIWKCPAPLDFFATDTKPTSIQIGRYDTGLQGVRLLSEGQNVELGKYTISEKFKNFLDYSPYTQISIYLPYLGFVDLPTNKIMGTTISVYVGVDFVNETMTYNVKSDGLLVFEQSVNFSFKIPIALSSSMDYYTNLAQTGEKALGLASRLEIPSSSDLQTNVDGISITASSSPSGGRYSPLQPAICIQRPILNLPKNFNKVNGYVYNKTAKLSTLSGYTQIDNPQIRTFEKPITREEYDMIMQKMKSGIIL